MVNAVLKEAMLKLSILLLGFSASTQAHAASFISDDAHIYATQYMYGEANHAYRMAKREARRNGEPKPARPIEGLAYLAGEAKLISGSEVLPQNHRDSIKPTYQVPVYLVPETQTSIQSQDTPITVLTIECATAYEQFSRFSSAWVPTCLVMTASSNEAKE